MQKRGKNTSHLVCAYSCSLRCRHQRLVNNQQFCAARAKKKCSGWSQNQKRRCARRPTALHHFDPAVCRLTHTHTHTHTKRGASVCVHIWRELSELSRRTFSSCTVTVVCRVTGGRKLCKISDVFHIKLFLILDCIFKFSWFVFSKLGFCYCS